MGGEAYKLMFETEQSTGEWALLWFTGAFGGVRVIAQFYFLAKTSATSLAMSGIAMQALTIIIGIVVFGTEVTTLLALGVLATIVTSCVYAYLKTTTVLEKKPETTTKGSEMEARMGLTKAADDSA